MDWVRDHAGPHLNKHFGHLRRPDAPQQQTGACHGAGASWTPNKPPYDVNLPICPVSYSEEEKIAQREAGAVCCSARMLGCASPCRAEGSVFSFSA